MKKKKKVFYVLFVVIMVSVWSCKEGGKAGKSMLSPVSGATNELMVIMPKALWDGAVGDTIKQFFGQAQIGLPQGEPIFDLLNLPPARFEKNVKSHRNLLLVNISGKADSASVHFFDSPWAKSQKIFKITAPDEEAFFRIFDANKEKMMGVYLKAERDC